MSYLKGQIHAVAAMVKETDPDDAQLIADMIEGETDAFDRITRLIQEADAMHAQAEAVKALAEQYGERASLLSARARNMEDAAKQIAADIIEETGEAVKTPLCTISRRSIAPKPVVQDLDALPDEYAVWSRKPNMAAIKNAPDLPPGVVMDNGGVSYSIRRK